MNKRKTKYTFELTFAFQIMHNYHSANRVLNIVRGLKETGIEVTPVILNYTCEAIDVQNRFN